MVELVPIAMRVTMSANFIERLNAKNSLDLSLVEESWNWPSQEALTVAAQDRGNGEVNALNRDLELYSRTRLKSCRVVKLLRDAVDAAWDLEAA